MPICFPPCREIESAHAALESDQESSRAQMHNKSDVDGDAEDSRADLMLPSKSEEGQNADGKLHTEYEGN